MKINLLIILILFLSCNKSENQSKKINPKDTLLIAKQNLDDFSRISRTLTIFSDSTYTFKEIIKETNHSREESFEGFLKIKDDTLKFFPFEFDYNESETAVLKNGFVEFVDGQEPFRMKIEKTSLRVKNKIDFKTFKDYAVFTDYAKFENDGIYKSIDLNSNDLKKIESILKNEFQKNKSLRKYSDYLKQVTSLKNEKNEAIIGINCYCKNSHTVVSFQFYKIGMRDGGNCNVYIRLNLTTEKIELVNIAGLA
ncbi:hypothetical protein [Epilithonimonas lactis]|uniref:hypothetical protein n=1 Tax=Epilithonimonas lactis TaxID=421072 RepID=UPI00068EAF15|nr:hypothetical protein [Epilithonimonas lactis]SEP76473.1 hypothetical protein SAMN04488097_0573 [Epilithonimonas lactis]